MNTIDVGLESENKIKPLCKAAKLWAIYKAIINITDSDERPDYWLLCSSLLLKEFQLII